MIAQQRAIKRRPPPTSRKIRPFAFGVMDHVSEMSSRASFSECFDRFILRCICCSSSRFKRRRSAAGERGKPLGTWELKFRSLLKHGAMAQSSSQCFSRFFWFIFVFLVICCCKLLAISFVSHRWPFTHVPSPCRRSSWRHEFATGAPRVWCDCFDWETRWVNAWDNWSVIFPESICETWKAPFDLHFWYAKASGNGWLKMA